MEIEFGPGEEKLAIAFEQIAAMRTALLQLSLRSEIDGLIIGAVLSATDDREGVRKTWQAMLVDFYPLKALAHLRFQEDQESLDATLKHRVDFWNRVFGG